MHLEAVTERVWRSTWQWSIGGVPGTETLSISQLTRNRGNVMTWIYLWALMESWLVAVDLTERYAGSWSYIQGSTRNRENEGKTDNLGWMLYSVYTVLGVCCTWFMLYLVYAVLGVYCTRCMLYSVYAVLGVCCTQCMLYSVYAVLGVCCTRCLLYSVYAVLGVWCTRCMLYSVYAVLSVNSWSWHQEIERDDSTLCSAMMVEKEKWSMKMGMIWRIRADMRSQGTTCLFGSRRPHIVVFTCLIGSSTCRIRNGKLTRTRNSLESQFLMMISPISSHLSLSLPSPKNTKLSYPYLSLHAMIMS